MNGMTPMPILFDDQVVSGASFRSGFAFYLRTVAINELSDFNQCGVLVVGC
jgi:hypothetical protein